MLTSALALEFLRLEKFVTSCPRYLLRELLWSVHHNLCSGIHFVGRPNLLMTVIQYLQLTLFVLDV